MVRPVFIVVARDDSRQHRRVRRLLRFADHSCRGIFTAKTKKGKTLGMIRLRILGMVFIIGGVSLIVALNLSLGATPLNAAVVGLTYVLALAVVASRWVRRHRLM